MDGGDHTTTRTMTVVNNSVTFRAIWRTIETLTANKNSLWILTFTALKNETLILCNMRLQMRHKKCNFTWDTFPNGISRGLWSLFSLYWLTIIRLIDLNHQKNTSKSMNETHFQEMTTLLTLLDLPRSCQALRDFFESTSLRVFLCFSVQFLKSSRPLKSIFLRCWDTLLSSVWMLTSLSL